MNYQATADAGCCPRPEAGLTLILTGPFGGGGAVDWPQLISLLQTAHDHLYTYLDEAVTVSGGLVLVRQYAQSAVAAIGNGLRAVRVLYDRDALPDPETLDIFLDRSQHLDAEPPGAVRDDLFVPNNVTARRSPARHQIDAVQRFRRALTHPRLTKPDHQDHPTDHDLAPKREPSQ